MNDGDLGLEAAITDLVTVIRKKRKPSRHHARPILIAIGERLLAGDESEAEANVRRIADVVRSVSDDWQRAVQDELELACAEFIQSVDPRFLDHPRYDFHYTVRARERLEARLRAAERLDVAPSEDLLDRVARADETLQPYLRRRDGRGTTP